MMTVATVFVTTAFMTVMLYSTLHQQARARMMTPATVSTVDNLTMIVLAAAGFTLVVGAALALTVFVFTHRIAGPMHVIGRSLEQLAAGEIPPMRPLRRTDEFKDVHDTLRKVVDRVRDQRGRAVESMTELYNLAQTIAADGNPDTKNLCDELLACIDRRRSEALDTLAEPTANRSKPAGSEGREAAAGLAEAATGTSA